MSSYLMDEHQKGNYPILRRFNTLMGLFVDEINELEKQARTEHAPYDAIFKKRNGSWGTLRQDVVTEAPIRKKIDDFIAGEKSRRESGCPF